MRWNGVVWFGLFLFHMAHTNGFGGCSKRDATRHLSSVAALLGPGSSFPVECLWSP